MVFLPRSETSNSCDSSSCIDEYSIFNEYVKVGKRMQDVLTIDAYDFAIASMIVHYSESNLKTNAYGKGVNTASSQVGIFQITEATRKALNIPKLDSLTLSEQLLYYEKYLRNCNKNYLAKIKTSVDLHVLHFAPSRFNKNVLSKVNNKYLAALDLNKDNVITREDLFKFQIKRARNNNQIQTFIINQYDMKKT